MNHPGKVFLTLTAALLLLCPQIFAQEPSGEAAPPPAEQTDQDEDTNQLLQQFEKAPTLEGGTQKLYHIRNVNIHGAQYIDNSILRASSGLIPGDSIYLPATSSRQPSPACGTSASFRTSASVRPSKATASTWKFS